MADAEEPPAEAPAEGEAPPAEEPPATEEAPAEDAPAEAAPAEDAPPGDDALAAEEAPEGEAPEGEAPPAEEAPAEGNAPAEAAEGDAPAEAAPEADDAAEGEAPAPEAEAEEAPAPAEGDEEGAAALPEGEEAPVDDAMDREDLAVEERSDYVIEAREYMDAVAFAKKKLAAALVVQCYARGMFARSLARQSRYEMVYNRQTFLEHQQREAKDRSELREREIQRRMHPRTAADFECVTGGGVGGAARDVPDVRRGRQVLYEELEQWRVAETHKIEVADTLPEEKQRARYDLLLKENRAQAIEQRLGKMSEAKLWEMMDGTVKEVVTPSTMRARELAELYQGLTRAHLRVDERLDVLLHVKWTVKEFDHKVCRELTELIDREADLLNRGRGEKALEGLRKRISRAFLSFVDDPRCNPEAELRHARASQDLNPLVTGEGTAITG
ncbi:hypothetical protein T484DRAFT_2018087 [Baffinella frigidus]|nr:hypothetical protein T484DRAFT_2018087 [Cryptophyta sp. CCMP2293]